MTSTSKTTNGLWLTLREQDALTATEQNIVKIFSDDYFFEIPLYQRPYAWTTEEVEALLDDLLDAMNRDFESPYFLGSIVLIKSEDNARSEVVDGQQRLTTLTMLLCALRDISQDNQLDIFVRQAGNEYMGTEDRFRLRVRERDRAFFEDNIQKLDMLESFLSVDPVAFSDSQIHMLDNAKYLRKQLLSLDSNERARFAGYIAQKCFLVVVSASDGDSARRIFTVMNNRGLDLSPTDILKAVVLDAISGNQSQDDYAVKWESIEEGLGRDDFRDLFAHIRMIFRKDKLRGTLESEFQNYVLGDLNSQKATVFINDLLEPYADAYELVSTVSYESSENAEHINALLRHLNRLDNFDWIAPAIAYFRKKKGQTDNLLRFVRHLDRLAYGLFIRRANINERIERYARLIAAIEKDSELYAGESALQLSPTEREDILERLNGDIYGQVRLRNPLLLRLDSVLAEKGAVYEHPIITIEHVLPQNPPEVSQWIEWFPDEEERKQWTNRLANLVLLSRRKNGQALNYDYRAEETRITFKGTEQRHLH